MVSKSLEFWEREARLCPNPYLAEEALASIRDKRFHCLGGSIYALYPGVDPARMTPFIVAYQTISDYLDNLTDRLSVRDAQAFAQLHLAMSEALTPGQELSDYYRYYPFRDDGGYLNKLVLFCQDFIASLPGFPRIHAVQLRLTDRYAKLQTYKHLATPEREELMTAWLTALHPEIWGLTIWELAMATGSTLGVFSLCAVAASANLSAQGVQDLMKAYDPWLCGLHIFLDYYIDLEEDVQTNQLNFVLFYQNERDILAGYLKFWRQTQRYIQGLPGKRFHQIVCNGLTALYLSDPKTKKLRARKMNKWILWESGPAVGSLYAVCRLLRRLRHIR
jgi:tetraprenyl-beta-curcumene synthase